MRILNTVSDNESGWKTGAGGWWWRWLGGHCGGWTHRAEKYTTITTLSMWLLWCETLMKGSYTCPTLRIEQRYSFKGYVNFKHYYSYYLFSAIKRHLGETRIIQWCLAVY